jgi:hypothetical protein
MEIEPCAAHDLSMALKINPVRRRKKERFAVGLLECFKPSARGPAADERTEGGKKGDGV